MSLHARLDSFLDTNGLEAVWFARPNNFTWLTGGDNVVDASAPVGVAAAGYDGDGVTVVTDNIEAPRLRDEELAAGVDVETFQWYEGGLGDAIADVSPTPAAADFDVPGFETLSPTDLRQPLTDEQIEQYRTLSADVAEAVETVAREVSPTDTERDVAAELRRALSVRNTGAPVVLVGGGERAPKYRHYTPKDAELGSYALLSVTAHRNGLYTSCTRTIAFDAPEWLADRTEAAMRVEATALAATQAVGTDGGAASEVFEAVQSAYDAVGWDGEWRNHHQGGAAGFAGREWFGTPSADEAVVLPQAYAWNPTVQGAKSEDTTLVTEDDVETLSTTGEWPTEVVEAVGYDFELARHAPLRR
ncbi:M24 family metallopeptidase [Haloarcula marina]|uniref:M24 family metallopeptidase n=1 Tax=Haloarcula marina TaxID=2961574 RepID=UPI0020B8CD86|nr:M24 family metallopeptidase [Halomicroarcula marina]